MEKAAMAESKQWRFDPDAPDEEIEDEYNALRDALHEHIGKFNEKHHLAFGAIGLMLLDIAVTLRMVDYVTSVEKPSGLGLRRELDRLRGEVDELIRTSKKAADEFVPVAKQALTEDGGGGKLS
jgi:hypothetical protein